MTIDDIIEMYRNGVGSPGETTRTLTNEYLRLKSTKEYASFAICTIILEERMAMYKSMDITTINDKLIKRIFKIANGYFPLIIFADIFCC